MGDNPEWVERRLALILRNLQRMPDEYNAMKRHFPEWRDQRLLTFATIDEFKDKLNTVFKTANVASGVGSAASLMGTVSSIVGAYLSWKGVPSSSWVTAGARLSVAGNIAVPAVAFVEQGFTSRYMQQCQKCVDRDKEFSQPILQFLEYSRNLDQIVQEVFGCSIYSNIWQDVVAGWTEAVDISVSTSRDTRNIADMLIRRLGGKIPENILEEIGDAFRRNAGRMWSSSGTGILKSLQRIGELGRVPHVSMAISSVRIYSHAHGIWNGELVPSPITTIEWGRTSNWSIAGHCLFEAMSIFLDISNLVQRYNGVLSGESNYSRRLEEIKQGLMRELTAIENSILLNRWEENP